MVRKIIYCLLLIFLMCCSSVRPTVKQTATAQPSDFVVWTPNFRSDEMKNSYRISLKTKKNTITGLFFLKKSGDEWRGTFTNEMGAKAFDYIVTGKKCELLNVISMMDKWYIKKTVAADLYFFIHVDNPEAPFYEKLERYEQNGNRISQQKKRQVVVGQDGVVRMINNRRGLQYELKKMVELDPDKLIL